MKNSSIDDRSTILFWFHRNTRIRMKMNYVISSAMWTHRWVHWPNMLSWPMNCIESVVLIGWSRTTIVSEIIWNIYWKKRQPCNIGETSFIHWMTNKRVSPIFPRAVIRFVSSLLHKMVDSLAPSVTNLLVRGKTVAILQSIGSTSLKGESLCRWPSESSVSKKKWSRSR